MEQKKNETISAEEMAKSGKKPIVLHFQPTAFVKLTEAEDLRRWEANLRDKIGLDIPADLLHANICDTVTLPNQTDACDIKD